MKYGYGPLRGNELNPSGSRVGHIFWTTSHIFQMSRCDLGISHDLADYSGRDIFFHLKKGSEKCPTQADFLYWHQWHWMWMWHVRIHGESRVIEFQCQWCYGVFGALERGFSPWLHLWWLLVTSIVLQTHESKHSLEARRIQIRMSACSSQQILYLIRQLFRVSDDKTTIVKHSTMIPFFKDSCLMKRVCPRGWFKEMLNEDCSFRGASSQLQSHLHYHRWR